MATMPTLESHDGHRRYHGGPVWFPSRFALLLLLLLLLLYLACTAEAQSSSPSSPGTYPNGWNTTRFNPSMAIIIVVLISAFFFMGFFSIYIRQCSERPDPSIGPGGAAPGNRSRRAAARGLDDAVIQTFPTLVYADVKEHKIGKGALECAVCLSEFDDDDTLRLLPKCDHVFHPDCIDAWLSAHTTCPVCRANLALDPGAVAPDAAVPAAPPAVEEANAGALPAVEGAGSDERQREGADNSAAAAVSVPLDHVAITIDDAPAPEPVQKRAEPSAALPPIEKMVRIDSKSRLPWRSKSSLRPPRFPRSHSTGHSLTVVQPGEDCERYTLRLPEHIRRDVLAGKLQRSSSCASFPATGEGSTRKGGCGGEGTGGGSVGGRSFKLGKWDWVAKSDRWTFFTRTFSMRVSRGDAAEGSTRRGEGSARRGADAGDEPVAEGSTKPKAFTGVRRPFDCLGGAGGGRDDGAADGTAAAPLTPTKAVETARV